MVVVRENSEGEYVHVGGRVARGTPDEVAVQTAVHTRRGVERVLRYGIEAARERRGKLTLVTKSNAQRFGMAMWEDVLAELDCLLSLAACARDLELATAARPANHDGGDRLRGVLLRPVVWRRARASLR